MEAQTNCAAEAVIIIVTLVTPLLFPSDLSEYRYPAIDYVARAEAEGEDGFVEVIAMREVWAETYQLPLPPMEIPKYPRHLPEKPEMDV